MGSENSRERNRRSDRSNRKHGRNSQRGQTEETDLEAVEVPSYPLVSGKIWETPDNPEDVCGKFRKGVTVSVKGHKQFIKDELERYGYPNRAISRKIFGREWVVTDTYNSGRIVGIPTNPDGSERFYPMELLKFIRAPAEIPLTIDDHDEKTQHKYYKARGTDLIEGEEEVKRIVPAPTVEEKNRSPITKRREVSFENVEARTEANRTEWDVEEKRQSRKPSPERVGMSPANDRNPNHGSRRNLRAQPLRKNSRRRRVKPQRYALRWMLIEEQNRFAKAVWRMMENGDYARLASWHGWPGNGEWSRHRTAAFPIWNRMHVAAFEQALQRADEENGGSGIIALPYWDFSIGSGPKGDYLPEIVRGELSAFPATYLKYHEESERLNQPSVLRVYRDEVLLEALQDRRSTVPSEIAEMLEAPIFREFATTSASRRLNIEHLHNRIHAALSPIMMDLELSAHHPLFWLVHCNLDRIFEGYLQAHPETHLEIVGEGMSDLLPFRKPSNSTSNSKYASCLDAISPEMRPRFDRVPKPITDKCGERIGRAVLMFPNVDVRSLRRSYQLKVYTIPKEEMHFDFYAEPERLKQFFATTAGVMYSPVPESRSEVVPRRKSWFNVYCRIGAALEDLRITNPDYKLVVLAEDSDGKGYNLKELLGRGVLPKPIIGGPVFLNRQPISEGQQDYDVSVMQKYLRKFGYLNTPPSGFFDVATKSALVGFQRFAGIKVDGVLGSITRDRITQIRYTLIPDNKPARMLYFRPNQAVSYVIDTYPPYMSGDKFYNEVARCFDQWARASNLTFVRSVQPNMANIVIGFRNFSLFCTEPFEFGARGSVLCNVEESTISLDSSERWLLQSEPDRKGCFKLTPVLLHAIGHVIGLAPSPVESSVMNPFYNNKKRLLTENDYQSVARLVGQAMRYHR